MRYSKYAIRLPDARIDHLEELVEQDERYGWLVQVALALAALVVAAAGFLAFRRRV